MTGCYLSGNKVCGSCGGGVGGPTINNRDQGSALRRLVHCRQVGGYSKTLGTIGGARGGGGRAILYTTRRTACGVCGGVI